MPRRHPAGHYFMAVNFDQYNQAVRDLGAQMAKELITTGRTMGITHRSNSPSSTDSLSRIRDRYGNDKSGVINRVSFTNINRSLIYTMHGAGKGRGGKKGSRWLDKDGNRKSTNPKSLGKMGTGGRQSKPFIEQTLDGPNGVEKLADIIAEYQADAIVSSVFIK